jgi:TIR domain
MRAIFISYRREDSEGQAGRLFTDLAKHFGDDAVFMDVADIEPGRDFRRIIDDHVASCGVMLAIIGKSWIDARDPSGQRRLDDAKDFVRLETAAALKREIPVIPVLVSGAQMPRADQLPPDLVDLAYRNAVELTHARWDSDVHVLIKALSAHVEVRRLDADRTEAEAPALVSGNSVNLNTVNLSGVRDTTNNA